MVTHFTIRLSLPEPHGGRSCHLPHRAAHLSRHSHLHHRAATPGPAHAVNPPRPTATEPIRSSAAVLALVGRCGPVAPTRPRQRDRTQDRLALRPRGLGRPGRTDSLTGRSVAGRQSRRAQSRVTISGTLITTDRVTVKGPIATVNFWWWGKRHHHGGDVQVITAPDGWPIWVLPSLSALCTTRPAPESTLTCWSPPAPGATTSMADLADSGHEEERDRRTCTIEHGVD